MIHTAKTRLKHQSNNMNVLMEFIRRNVMNWYEKGIKIKDRNKF